MQRQFLRTGKTLASFKLDIATVMQQPGNTSSYAKLCMINIVQSNNKTLIRVKKRSYCIGIDLSWWNQS